jgi:hypothetical protein
MCDSHIAIFSCKNQLKKERICMTNSTDGTINQSQKQSESNVQEKELPQTKLEAIISRTARRIERLTERVDRITKRHTHIKENGGTLTEHGGWERGYHEGKLSTLEDLLDDLNELKILLNGKGE